VEIYQVQRLVFFHLICSSDSPFFIYKKGKKKKELMIAQFRRVTQHVSPHFIIQHEMNPITCAT